MTSLTRVSILALVSATWILQPANLASQAQQAADRARGHSARHLDDLAAKHGNGDTRHRELRLQIDERRRAHRKVQQLHRGVPVFGGEAIVHTAEDGTLEGVTDNYLTGIGPVDTVPLLTPEDAVTAALAAYGADRSVLTAPPLTDLWILREDGDHLAYRVRLRREDGTHDTALPVYFIDAADGSVLFAYDNLQSQSAIGSGTSLYSGTVQISTYQDGGTYYLEDVDRKLGTFTMNNTTTTQTRISETDNVFDSASQKAAVDAHFGAAQMFEYLLNVHGRQGIYGNLSFPGLIPSRVHYSTNYCNAFWNGSSMTYGDGDGTSCFPLVSLDVVGHEMGHGVIEQTANLTYSGESGGLNESFADILGAMTERYTRGMSANVWLIGDEILPPFLRSMANPPADGSSPDYYTASVGGLDVHYSSGIQNKAFYLLSAGGTHPHSNVTVIDIGPGKAEQIFYKALTTYMTSSTNYAGARTATLNAATALYGSFSDEYDAVATAWCAVGVGACPVPDVTAPTTIASAAGYSFGSLTNHTVTVALTATDNVDGSGVASLVYSATGATTLPATTTGGNATIPVTADGETIISFQATDNAGNTETLQTRVVRIDLSPPSATAAASPSTLWPPNGKPVTVTISGVLLDPAGVASASYVVDDEYGQVSSSGAIAVAADGSYQFTIQLPASRLGTDKDGRVFTIRIVTTDTVGNTATAETRVVVPHSQGQ
jgi:thermolysin